VLQEEKEETTVEEKKEERGDPTENIRRRLVEEVNSMAGPRMELEAVHGQVWDTDELSRDFIVRGFMAPFVIVSRRSDGVTGTCMFQHSPRYYFAFTPDRA